MKVNPDDMMPETGPHSRAWNEREFVAKQIARADSRNWGRLPNVAVWFRDRMHYRQLAQQGLAAKKIWDAYRTYIDSTKSRGEGSMSHDIPKLEPMWRVPYWALEMPPLDAEPAREHPPASNDNVPERERGPYIGTFTGRFYMTDPRPEEFTIQDVAHGLANICRYTGACKERQSVAEHSVLITRWVREQGGSHDEQLCALLHDAPEALSGFGDVARPAKQLAPIIKATEENIWRKAVAPKFGLPLELPAIVHEADNRIIADEMSQNMREVDPAYTNPLRVDLKYWYPRTAEVEFMAEFWRIIESGRH